MKILAIRLKNLASLAGPFEIDFTAEAGASTFLDIVAESVDKVVLNGNVLDAGAFADARGPMRCRACR